MTLAWVAATLCAANAHAQIVPAQSTTDGPSPGSDWQLAPVLEVRMRAEYRHDLDNQDRSILVERARLGIDASRGPLGARLVMQDARAFDLVSDTDMIPGPVRLMATDAHEAWADVHTPSIRPSFFRVGRQSIVWGEGRLLGAAEWSPQGRALDALRGRLVIGDGAAELLAAVLQDPTVAGGAIEGSAYGELFGARGQWAFDPLFSVDAYGLAVVAQENPQDASATIGGTIKGETYTCALRVWGDSQDWAWSTEGAYQFGHVAALAVARSAFAGAAHLSHTFTGVALKPTVGVGGAYATGDDGGKTYHAFDPLLPDVHTWHGAMDVFAWSNEAEASAKVAIVPWADGAASLEYRYARLARAAGAWESGYLLTIGRLASNDKTSLGSEVDATVAWSPWGPVELVVGYSILALGDGARAILAARAPGASSAAVSQFAIAQASIRY